MPPADPGRPWAVLDIDGVLADVRHRLPLLARGARSRPDWEAFFARAGDDPLLAEGLAVVRRLADEHEVVYVSGRPERLRAVTLAWLERHGLPTGLLLLRRDGDRRPARVLKREVVRRLAHERPVAVVVDDDVDVAAALRRAGFPVLLADWAVAEPAPAGRLREAQEEQGVT